MGCSNLDKWMCVLTWICGLMTQQLIQLRSPYWNPHDIIVLSIFYQLSLFNKFLIKMRISLKINLLSKFVISVRLISLHSVILVIILKLFLIICFQSWLLSHLLIKTRCFKHQCLTWYWLTLPVTYFLRKSYLWLLLV